MMNRKALIDFFNERPALSKSAFAREAGISYQLINYIISEDRKLTDDTISKVQPVMQKYGWSKK